MVLLSHRPPRPAGGTTAPRAGRAATRSARLVSVLQAAAGGLLTETAFPDRSWWPMAFVGVALLVLALDRDSPRWAGLVGFVWALGLFVPHLYWANEAAGVLPWLALSVLQAALVAVGTTAWALTRRVPRLNRYGPLPAAAFALVWAAAEQLRSSWPFGGFPWARLAFSQTEGPLLTLAWLAGAPLVSAAVAFGGFTLAATLTLVRAHRLRSAALTAAATIALPLAGAAIPLDTDPQSGTLRLAAVQGNVPDDDTQGPSRSRVILDNHVAGTLALLDQVAPGDLDVVLWPENATDIDPRADDDARGVVDEAAQALDAPILVGTDRYTDAGRYNDMLLWEPGAGPTLSYSKQRPAPFGEYIPWRPFVRLFSAEVDRVSIDMIPGQEPAIVPIPTPRLNRDVPFATIICFEVAYDALIREAVLQGAELIVVPTNNASFGLTAESTQQLAMSRLRAVEHGRATIQISTVGVSAIIAPDGSVLQQTQLFTPDQMLAELPLRTSLTPADQLGEWPTIAIVALSLVALLSGLVTTLGSSRRDRAAIASGATGPAEPSSELDRRSTQPGAGTRQPELDDADATAN